MKLINKLLSNNPFIRSIAVLSSGTGIAQIFPLITAPIISRLYTPDDFGVYAIFYSLVTVFTGFSMLEYHNIILLAKTKEKSTNGIALSLLMTLLISSLLLIVVLLLPDAWLINVLGKGILPYLWIFPITVVLNAVFTVFYNWFLRNREYRFLSRNKIFIAFIAAIVQISFGFLNIGALGFILANLLTFSIVVGIFFLRYRKKYFIQFYKAIQLKEIKDLMYTYGNFPKFTVWAQFVNTFTVYLPDFIFNKIFGTNVLGQYSLAQRMISFPMSFISVSIQDVFRQSASEEYTNTGRIIISFKRTFKILLILGIPALICFITFVPELFVIIFGDQWKASGNFVRVLSILFVIRFIVAPLSYSFIVLDKQDYDLYWQIGLLIITAFSLLGGSFYFSIKEPVKLLLIYSIIISFWYIVNLLISFSIVKGSKKV